MTIIIDVASLSHADLARELLSLRDRIQPRIWESDHHLLITLEAQLRQGHLQGNRLSSHDRSRAEALLKSFRSLDPLHVAASSAIELIKAIREQGLHTNGRRTEQQQPIQMPQPAYPLWLDPDLISTDIDVNELLLSLGQRLSADPILETTANGAKMVVMTNPFQPGVELEPADLHGLSDMRFLHHGPPGSGKSELAKDICGRLGLLLRIVPYSEIAHSYVGETEKELSRTFAAAAADNYALLFDEADSLLADRGRAKNSWERTQTAQFLTLLDTHKLPVFLTTNFVDDLDEALARRLSLVIEFRYLTLVGVRAAFERFFQFDPPAGLDDLEFLTPGNFVTVIKRARMLGFEGDPERLLKGLQVLDDKARARHGSRSRAIGFQTTQVQRQG